MAAFAAGTTSRPTELTAFAQLSEVIAEDENAEGWAQRAVAALRVSALAVEERLDAIQGASGLAAEYRREEPSLDVPFARLGRRFNDLLAESWAAEKAATGPLAQFKRELEQLAVDFRAAIGHEFSVTEDAQNRMSTAVD